MRKTDVYQRQRSPGNGGCLQKSQCKIAGGISYAFRAKNTRNYTNEKGRRAG